MNSTFPHAILLLAALALNACKKASTTTTVTPTLPPITSQPLAPPTAAPDGEPLFEKLDPAASGIGFKHVWKPRNSFDELLQKTGFTGGGVALGDYDGDGLCDVYLTSPHGGGRLYRNLGGFKFEDATEVAGVGTGEAWTTGATFIDADNDGLLDLFVCAYESDNHLFVNQGDGSFADRIGSSGLNFIGANVKMAFADIDGDSDLDAYLVTNRLEPVDNPKIDYLGSPGNYSVAPHHQELVSVINLPDGTQKFTKAGQFDHLYRNEFAQTGELRFTDISKTAGIAGPDHGLDATWWDYDNDGDPDLYVSNDFTDPDKFYRNRGDGTFEDVLAETVPHTPWFTMGSAAGDLNGDGLLDLVAADMSATSHYREKVSMGAMDAVAWFLDTADPRQYMRNAVYLGTGTDRFMEVAHLAGLASSNWTWSIKIADLDGDGREDVFATNGFPFDYLNSDFAASLAKSGNQTNPAAWRTAPKLPEHNIAFQNGGDLHFGKTGKDWGLDELAISFGSGIGDLDGDGDPDLIVNNFDAPPSLYRNRSESHWLAVQLRGTTSNPNGLGALITAETGSGEHVRYVNGGGGFMSSDEPGVCLFGLGDQDKAKTLTVRWPSGIVQRFTDLDAGQQHTIAEPVGGTPEIRSSPRPTMFTASDRLDGIRHSERPFDDFAREPLLPNKLSQLGPALSVGGELFYLGGASGSPGQLFRSDGTKLDQAAFNADAACEDIGSAFFDADDDGDLDLYVTSGGNEAEPGHASYADRLYLNENGTFTRAAAGVLPENTDSSGPVAAADFDKDGDIDLFVGGRLVPGAYPTAPPSRMLRNDGGRFVEQESMPLGMVTDAIWSDIDGDDDPDLIVTTEYGPVQCFVNTNGTFAPHAVDALSKLEGWWNSIAAADVDGDGNTDFAVTNFGLNTKYHPSAKKPQVIYYNDFAGDGNPQIVEAKLAGGTLLPVRGKSCSTAAMPHLANKFGTFHDFASATLEEIYSDSALDAGLKLQATTLDSGMLINDGSGNFHFVPLPRIAQASPSFGATFLDADGDAHPDLFLAQNFFGPQRETGHMDGGLGQLLLGRGDGTFAPVSPAKSGIVIPEAATAAMAMDLNSDGTDDLIIATNNGPVRLFLNFRGR